MRTTIDTNPVARFRATIVTGCLVALVATATVAGLSTAPAHAAPPTPKPCTWKPDHLSAEQHVPICVTTSTQWLDWEPDHWYARDVQLGCPREHPYAWSWSVESPDTDWARFYVHDYEQTPDYAMFRFRALRVFSGMSKKWRFNLYCSSVPTTRDVRPWYDFRGHTEER